MTTTDPAPAPTMTPAEHLARARKLAAHADQWMEKSPLETFRYLGETHTRFSVGGLASLHYATALYAGATAHAGLAQAATTTGVGS